MGFNYETAALIVSLASFVLVTAGLWHLMRVLDPTRWAARAAVLCWLINSYALSTSVAAVSEPLFTVFSLATLLFLVNADEKYASTHNGMYWVGSAVMAGASYWVRYAGILWGLTCVTLLVVQIAARGKRDIPLRRSAILAVTALLVLLVFFAPVIIRNVTLIGNWRGGNTVPGATPVPELVIATPRILHHLLFGDGTSSQLRVPMLLVSIGLVGMVGACLVWLRATAPFQQVLSWRPPLTKAGIVLAAFLIYSFGIAAIAARSVISYSPRMYTPVLPHLIALITCGVAFLIRRLPAGNYSRSVSIAMVVCLLSGYGIANVISRTSVGPDAYEKTEKALLEPDETGRPLKQRIEQELTRGEVIAATNGQAAGYVLQHPTISLVGQPYSRMNWTASTVRAELIRFGANHLLVFRDAALDPVIQESPFLGELATGKAPAWLPLACLNRDVYVYRVDTSASGADVLSAW
jgi:Dolichyl-phosphate-mannose-protein mannosyltransferase